jgi:dihydrofolate reductase
MEITAIAAVGRNGVIGAGNDIPWNIPADWRRFKQVTLGGSLIMGRRTFESIGKPLPGRTSLVISRTPDEAARAAAVTAPAGTEVRFLSSIEEAIAAADPSRPVFVAGGGAIYSAAWPHLTRLDITEVDAEPPGDTFFPSIDPAEWVEVSREPHPGYAFVKYERVRPSRP